MFEAAERRTNTVQSVTLVHTRYGEELPLNHNPLGVPRRSDVPTPHCPFIDEWCRKCRSFGDTTQSTVAELFVIENMKAAKKLEIFIWTLEQVDNDDDEISLHYAFLLQSVDM